MKWRAWHRYIVFLLRDNCLLQPLRSRSFCNVAIYRERINYRRILQNHIFTNTEQKYMMLLPFEREMFCSFVVTLNAFDMRPTCDMADVQAILPFPPNPLKHVLCVTFPIAVLMRSRNSGSVFGSGGTFKW